MEKRPGNNGFHRSKGRGLLKPLHEQAEILPQTSFLRALRLEHRRAERSGRLFCLALIELGDSTEAGRVLGELGETFTTAIRETDLAGWYRANFVLGFVFTELGSQECRVAARALRVRILKHARTVLSVDQVRELKLSVYLFPEDGKHPSGDRNHPLLYPELANESDRNAGALPLKRFVDIAGSLFALTLMSPLLLVIAIAIKLTSKGPVFFRQQRMGQYGCRFPMLKFRSMYSSNNHSPHQEYVKQFIAGTTESGKTYKLTSDSRVTSIGKFLRRSSFDELPQFINVLWGDMSLVGPRPPVLYEVECYEAWHRRRYLTVKPGITGLWQVQGRSRVKFDEMVRMDLRYAKSRSIWLDIKILAQTPRAVIAGDGAY